MTSRREFLGGTAAAGIGLWVPAPDPAAPLPGAAPPRGFLDLRRPPDGVWVQTPGDYVRLAAGGGGQWTGHGVTVTTVERGQELHVALTAPSSAVSRVHLRWRGSLDSTRLILGDAWERGYGDLEWRGWVPDRVLPWYLAMHDGTHTHAYGVRTGAGALCFWRADPSGLSLWADVRSGGAGIELGERTLPVCDVVCRAGREGESAHAAVHAFCRQMCALPRLPSHPVYGSNDWYWAYGKNSAESALADAEHIVELSPPGENRPFAVIDDGWQPGRGTDQAGAGTWDRGNEKFPDLPGLAGRIRRAGARPGLWIRPLQAPADAPDAWRLARDRAALDPTVPGVPEKIAADIARLRGWGFELIKHDYTTYDILGRWGFQMGTALTGEGWAFGEGRSRTTAEVIAGLYRTIGTAAGGGLVIGCNTVSHLSAGYFEICRIGDDTSGTEWARTRRMGVNALAFRGPQHGAFYVADADCVGVTSVIPWALNRRWLDLLARSGTSLFVSLAPDALGAATRRDLRAALALAANPQPLAEPLDWLGTVTPARWRASGVERTYDWFDADGAGPP